MSGWIGDHIFVAGATAFVALAFIVGWLLHRWWKVLLPIPVVVGVLFWNAWNQSGFGAFLATWIVILLYVGLALGAVLPRSVARLARRAAN